MTHLGTTRIVGTLSAIKSRMKYPLDNPFAKNQLMADFDYACAVCGTSKRLCVDHDHATNEIRGVICHRCNLLLGKARDNVKLLKKAIAYLERGNWVPSSPVPTAADYFYRSGFDRVLQATEAHKRRMENRNWIETVSVESINLNTVGTMP